MATSKRAPGPSDGRTAERKERLRQKLPALSSLASLNERLKALGTPPAPKAPSETKAKKIAKSILTEKRVNAKRNNLNDTQKAYINMEYIREIQQNTEGGTKLSAKLSLMSLVIVKELQLDGDPSEVLLKNAIRNKLLAVIELKHLLVEGLLQIKKEVVGLIDDHWMYPGKSEHPKLTALNPLISYIDTKLIFGSLFFNNLGQHCESFKTRIAVLNLDEEVIKLFPALGDPKKSVFKNKLVETLKAHQMLVIQYSQAYQELVNNVQATAERLGKNNQLKQWEEAIVSSWMDKLQHHPDYLRNSNLATMINCERRLIEKSKKNPDYDWNANPEDFYAEILSSVDLNKQEAESKAQRIIAEIPDVISRMNREASKLFQSLLGDVKPVLEESKSEKLSLTTKRDSKPEKMANDLSLAELAELKDKITTLELTPVAISSSDISVVSEKKSGHLPNLIDACRQGNYEAVVKVLPKKNKNKKYQINHNDQKKNDYLEALYLCCELGDVKIFNYLLARINFERSINNFCAGKDKNPLMIASEKGHVEIVKRLLTQTHINPGLINSSNQTALTLATDVKIRSMIQDKMKQFLTNPFQDEVDHTKAVAIPAHVEQKDVLSSSLEAEQDTERLMSEVCDYFEKAKIKRKELKDKIDACETLLKRFETRSLIDVMMLKEEFQILLKSYQQMDQSEQPLLATYDQITAKKQRLNLLDLKNLQKNNVKKNHERVVRRRDELERKIDFLKEKIERLNNEAQLVADQKEASVPSRAAMKPKASQEKIKSGPAIEVKASDRAIEENGKDVGSYPNAAPNQPTLLMYLDLSLYQEFRSKKLKQLKEYVAYEYAKEFKESNVVFKKLQIEGIFFEIIQLMEKQKHIKEGIEKSIQLSQARLVRNALKHRKKLFSEVISPQELDEVYAKIMEFTHAFITAFEKNERVDLASTAFGKEILRHGMELKAQKDSGNQEEITGADRMMYTLVMTSKSLVFTQFKSTWIEGGNTILNALYESAMSMVIVVNRVYGLFNPAAINYKAADDAVHVESALTRPIPR